MSRMEFTKETKRSALKRAKNRCEAIGKMFGLPAGQRCSMPLATGVRFEHINPDANSRDNSLENAAAVCPACWRWKTDNYDKPLIAKTDRQKDRFDGTETSVSRPMPCGRGSRWKKTFGGRVVPR